MCVAQLDDTHQTLPQNSKQQLFWFLRLNNLTCGGLCANQCNSECLVSYHVTRIGLSFHLRKTRKSSLQRHLAVTSV